MAGDELATSIAGRSCHAGKERDRLTAAAHRMLAEAGLRWSASRVRTIVARHQREATGRSLELRDLLSYADPTGNQAARHVDRERGWR